MAENKNHLGLDKFQVTVIKSNYNSTKPIRKMMEKANTKIFAADEKYQAALKVALDKYNETVKDLKAEVQAYKDQIAMLDKFTMETTKQTCGLELTSEQVMHFIDNPDAFAAYKASKEGQDLFTNQDIAEQPKAEENEMPWDENADEANAAATEYKEAV